MVVSNGIGSRFGVFTTALLTITDAMKALTIPASRPGKRVDMSAAVAALRSRISDRTIIPASVAATAVCFVSLILDAEITMYISGLAALLGIRISETAKGGEL